MAENQSLAADQCESMRASAGGKEGLECAHSRQGKVYTRKAVFEKLRADDERRKEDIPLTMV